MIHLRWRFWSSAASAVSAKVVNADQSGAGKRNSGRYGYSHFKSGVPQMHIVSGGVRDSGEFAKPC